jgi:hypothetical protein
MARYVGGAVMTAVAAGIYGNVGAAQVAGGAPPEDALASGFAAASLALAIFSAAGIVLAVLARRAARRGPAIAEYAAAAAATTHTLPVPEVATAGAR